MVDLYGPCAAQPLTPSPGNITGNSTYPPPSVAYCYERCGLGSNLYTNLCTYGYVVAGVSILASLALTFLLCFTFNCCGLGIVLDLIFAGAGALWWAAAASVFSASKTVPTLVNPDTGYDTAVVVLAWVNTGLFAFVFLAYGMKIWGNLCPCCACCEDPEKDFHKV